MILYTGVETYIEVHSIQPADPQHVHVLILHAVFNEWDTQRQVSDISPARQCIRHRHYIACAYKSCWGSEQGLGV